MDARRLRNSKEDLRNTPSRSEGCISVHIPLRNSNKVSESGLNNVSYIREVYLSESGSRTKRIEPVVSWVP